MWWNFVYFTFILWSNFKNFHNILPLLAIERIMNLESWTGGGEISPPLRPRGVNFTIGGPFVIVRLLIQMPGNSIIVTTLLLSASREKKITISTEEKCFLDTVHWLLLQSFHNHLIYFLLESGQRRKISTKKARKTVTLRLHLICFAKTIERELEQWIGRVGKIATRHASLSFFFQGVLSSFSKAHSRTEKIDPLLQTCR